MEIVIVLFVLVVVFIIIGTILNKFTWRTAIQYLLILLVIAVAVILIFRYTGV